MCVCVHVCKTVPCPHACMLLFSSDITKNCKQGNTVFHHFTRRFQSVFCAFPMKMSVSMLCGESINQSVKLTKGQWLPDCSMQPTVYPVWAGDVSPTPCLIRALPSARLLPRANPGGGRRSVCVFWGLRGGKIGSWKPAKTLTDSSAGAQKETLRQTERSPSHAPHLPRCGVKPCQICVLCFDASTLQNSCRHVQSSLNHAWHSPRHRHVGPALAHKPWESLSVFQQTLLDQTGQESLVKYLRKNSCRTKTKHSPKQN